MLVVDDLGAQQANNWIDSKVDQLLTHRFNGRLPTVIVLAKPISEMPERIALKLDDPGLSTVVQLTDSETSRGTPRFQYPQSDAGTYDVRDVRSQRSPCHRNPTNQSVFATWHLSTRLEDFREEGNPEKWLYLHGRLGVGKTHIAVAIAKCSSGKRWIAYYFLVGLQTSLTI